jgi:hypothetical protein
MSDPISPDPGAASKPRALALSLSLVCLLLPLLPSLSSAEVAATIDRSAISLDETVQLTIETVDEPASQPDLSVLAADFQILDRRSSRSVSVINGQRSERHVLTLRLLPRRFGELTIPAIPAGEAATLPLRLSVAERAQGIAERASTPAIPTESSEPPPSPSAILEVVLEPAEVYRGQQTILTAKVFTDGPIRRPLLRDPQIPNTEVLPLGEDRYQAQHDGQSHHVYERRYALFPQESGHLEIGPLLFEGWVSNAGGAQSGIGYSGPGQRVNARSRALTAKVLPTPDDADPDHWLPARSLTLSESGPETYRAQVGEPIERRISLRADGIMARNLPALTVRAPHQIVRRQKRPLLRDERRPEGVVGTRQEIITLTAQEPGRYRLPPITLEWWSTTAGRREAAMLPARELVVSAGQPPVSGLPTGSAQPWQQPSQPAVPETTQNAPATRSEMRPEDPVGSNSRGFWTWMAIALGAAWMTTMAAWWRSKRRTSPSKSASTELEPEPVAASTAADPFQGEIDAVRAAYELGSAVAAREALLVWAEQALPEQRPSNLARLARCCSEPLRSQILLLEEAFFSPSPLPWDEQPVWEHLPEFVPAPQEEPASFRRGKPIRRRAPNPDAE